MVNKFNDWGLWTMEEILKYDGLSSRAAALSLFIDVAYVCNLLFYSFGDFNFV